MFAHIGLDPKSVWPEVKIRPPPVHEFSGTPPPETRPFLTLPEANGAPIEDDSFVSEEEEDLADATSDINDMLEIAKSWWIMELIPQKIKFQKDDDTWMTKISYV